MKKHTLKKAFALLITLAMMIPFVPVVATAATTTSVTPTTIQLSDLTDADKAWYDNDPDATTFTISNRNELAYFMLLGQGDTPVTFAGKTVKLSKDIEWNDGTIVNGVFTAGESGVIYEWKSYASTQSVSAHTYAFQGTFDGGLHTITGLYINGTGFFNVVKAATIQNVCFEKCYLSTDKNQVGIVASRSIFTNNFLRIHLMGCYLNTSGAYAGGVLGAPANGTGTRNFNDCVVDKSTSLTAATKAGSFVGQNFKGNLNLTECINFTNNQYVAIGGADKTESSIDVKVTNCLTVNENETKLYDSDANTWTGEDITFPTVDTDNVAIKIEGVQKRPQAGSNKFDLRFVASFDLNGKDTSYYKQIGFEISLLSDYAKSQNLQTEACTTVYTSIKSDSGETIDANTDFQADYVATLVVTDIPGWDSQAFLVRTYYSTSTDAADRVYGAYALVTCVNGEVVDTRYLTEYVETVEEASQVLASSYNTDTYDLAPLLPDGASDISVKASKGQAVNGTTVSLNVGENYFDVTYTENGTETTEIIAIARRAGHRVVFNSNGGSYIAPQSVADGGKLTSYTPTLGEENREFQFLGWYRQDGTLFDFSNDTVTNDMMLVAHWQAPEEPANTDTDDALTYNTPSAAINIVWKDYANAFSARPASVTCTLSDGTDSYKVVVTENGASFENGAPAGAEISTGAGNWTVKITGLDGNKSYTFTADDLSTNAYEKQQSGTAVTYTLNGYNPMLDDSAWLLTQNGRLYDYAGNVVVLKGVVAFNVGWSNFEDNVSMAALTRLQSEGVNCIRVTVFVENAGNNSYHTADEQRRAELRTMLKVAIDNASSLGMYCIVDWGILASIEMTDEVNASAKELFVTLATDYKDNPYVIYEICNEPENNTWSSIVKDYAEDVIEAIREAGSNAIVIVGPDNSATNISKGGVSNDPIDAPIATILAYNVAYSFHTYTYSREYSHGDYCYGWILRDALEAGLTVISTEFSPADAAMSDATLNIDVKEADKFLNLFLENDMSYVFFRYISKDKSCGQYMFRENVTESLNDGSWTTDMLSDSGKWFYDSTMNSDGWIKNADFGYNPTTRGY